MLATPRTEDKHADNEIANLDPNEAPQPDTVPALSPDELKERNKQAHKDKGARRAETRKQEREKTAEEKAKKKPKKKGGKKTKGGEGSQERSKTTSSQATAQVRQSPDVSNDAVEGEQYGGDIHAGDELGGGDDRKDEHKVPEPEGDEHEDHELEADGHEENVHEEDGQEEVRQEDIGQEVVGNEEVEHAEVEHEADQRVETTESSPSQRRRPDRDILHNNHMFAPLSGGAIAGPNLEPPDDQQQHFSSGRHPDFVDMMDTTLRTALWRTVILANYYWDRPRSEVQLEAAVLACGQQEQHIELAVQETFSKKPVHRVDKKISCSIRYRSETTPTT